MHGKKRTEYKAKLQDPTVAALLSEKAVGWHQLCSALELRRKEMVKQSSSSSKTTIDEETSKTTLALLSKALLVNPDPLHLWNHRREWILQLLAISSSSTSSSQQEQQNPNDDNKEGEPSPPPPQQQATATTPTALLILQSELDLTRSALERHPKAYGAWMHRKWILGKLRPTSIVLEQERDLTTLFLKLDERNFHCWNYRRFIIGCLLSSVDDNTSTDPNSWTGEWKNYPMGKQLAGRMTTTTTKSTDSTTSGIVPGQDQDETTATTTSTTASILQMEWDFTTEKITDNFSNFSAFFYRSQLLPLVFFPTVTTNDTDDESSNKIKIWEKELELIENAICTEPDDQTAWWYHALLFQMDGCPILDLQDRLLSHVELLRELVQDSPQCKWIWMGIHRILKLLNDPEEHTTELCSCLHKLQEIDPDRLQRYQELLRMESTTNTV